MNELEKFFLEEKELKRKIYKHMNTLVQKGQILFTGSSLMEQFPVNEIALNYGVDAVIYNRGIGGYTIPEMIEAVEEQVLELVPSKIFINIGTNDISILDETEEKFEGDYRRLLNIIKRELPDAAVYMMAYYPVSPEVAKDMPGDGYITSVNYRLERLDKANAVARKLAKEFNYKFIDVNDGLCNSEGHLRPELSKDGIHMWPEAYDIVFNNMKKYILE